MELQEIFNTVWNGLLSQMRKSTKLGDSLSCKYRGAEGRKCAAGFLIPDEEYIPEWDTVCTPSWGNRREEYTHSNSSEYAPMSEEAADKFLALQERIGYVTLVRELQGIHDSYFPADWEEQLRLFAQRYGLTCPPVPARTEVQQ